MNRCHFRFRIAVVFRFPSSSSFIVILAFIKMKAIRKWRNNKMILKVRFFNSLGIEEASGRKGVGFNWRKGFEVCFFLLNNFRSKSWNIKFIIIYIAYTNNIIVRWLPMEEISFANLDAVSVRNRERQKPKIVLSYNKK